MSDWHTRLAILSSLISSHRTLQDKYQALRWLAQHNLYFLANWVLAWNISSEIAGMSVRFHGPLCRQLDGIGRPYARELDLWPRGRLKTTLITVAKSIQYYLQDHNVRILLASASIDGATKNLRTIKQQFATNPILHWLFPECRPDMRRDKWAETEVCLPRDRNLPESTFKAIGVGGHITGWHFDVLIKDDLIDEKTATPALMEEVIDWHLLTHNLLESPSLGVDHLVGTRWTAGDLYQWVMTHESEYRVRVVQALTRDGQSTWPERFPLEDAIDARGVRRPGLLAMRQTDPYKFACQQMNDPRLEDIVAFRADWLQYYTFANQEQDVLIESGTA